MAELLFSIPRSTSKRLEEAIKLAKQFSGFRELADGFELRPSILDVQTGRFQELLRIAGKWKGSLFFEDGRPLSLQEFKRIGLRVGDPVEQKASADWMETRAWYGWERPQRLISPADNEHLEEVIPACERGTAAYPVEVEFAENQDREEGRFLYAIHANVNGALVGYLWPKQAEALLNSLETLSPLRYPGVVVRGRYFCQLYIWPDRPLTDGVRIQDTDAFEEGRWWSDDVSFNHEFALWKLKFPDRKEPIERFDERIRADLEGRELALLPSSIKQRERRKQKKAEADRRKEEGPPPSPQGCGSQAAALLALAWLFSLLRVNADQVLTSGTSFF